MNINNPTGSVHKSYVNGNLVADGMKYDKENYITTNTLTTWENSLFSFL